MPRPDHEKIRHAEPHTQVRCTRIQESYHDPLYEIAAATRDESLLFRMKRYSRSTQDMPAAAIVDATRRGNSWGLPPRPDPRTLAHRPGHPCVPRGLAGDT